MAFGFIGKFLNKRDKTSLTELQHLHGEGPPRDRHDSTGENSPARALHVPHTPTPKPADVPDPPPAVAKLATPAIAKSEEQATPANVGVSPTDDSTAVSAAYDLDVPVNTETPTSSPIDKPPPSESSPVSPAGQQTSPEPEAAPEPLTQREQAEEAADLPADSGDLDPENVPAPTKPPKSPEAAAIDPKVSQTFRVPATGSRSQPLETQLNSPMTARNAKASKTFRVPPQTNRSSLQPESVSPVASDDIKVSQTFRMAAPGRENNDASTPLPTSHTEPDISAELPEDGVELPLEFMLRELSPDCRGPAWDETRFPDTVLELSREDIAHVLRKRRMRVSIDDFRALVPEGWVSDDATGEVEVPLADLISVLPQNVFEDTEPDSEFEKLFAVKDEDKVAEEAAAVTLGTTGEKIEIPCKAALARLETGWRGPKWDARLLPNTNLYLPLSDIRDQLATGRVFVPAALLRDMLPEGILADVAEGDVEIDLQTVVMALAPAELMTSREDAEDVKAAAGMPDFFKPSSDVTPPSGPTTPDRSEPVAGATPTDIGETIELPCAVVLLALPEEMRGTEWQADGRPHQTISLPRQALLMQLGTGKVAISLDQIRTQVPEGWFAPDASGSISLSLAEVVAAIPSDQLASTQPMQDDVAEAGRLPDFFKAQNVAPESPAVSKGTRGKTPPAETENPVPPPAPGETVWLPSATILTSLRDEQRGAEWRQEDMPDGTVPVPRQTLLAQLSSGSVCVSIRDIRDHIPPGWLAPNAEGAINLNLAAVVAALPSDLLTVEAPLADGVEDAATMPEFFRPSPGTAAKIEQVPKATEQFEEPILSSTEMRTAETDEKAPSAEPDDEVFPAIETEDSLLEGMPEWNGIEPNLERAPRGVDINAASIGELTEVVGVGEFRAEAIVSHRMENGPFTSIYELANVPGIGPSMFHRMTGLSLAKRTDRHQVLIDLLELEESNAPLIQQIVARMTGLLRASGGLATTIEGIALATTGSIDSDAARYAALGARFFFKTKRHVERFVESASDCIILPGNKPPLMVLAHGNIVFIFTLKATSVPAKKLISARRAVREVSWLMSRRAVVTSV